MEEVGHVQHVCVSNPHLTNQCQSQDQIGFETLTVSSSNFFCSSLLMARSFSRRSLFIWLNSSACCLSLSCCFFSISARRFCAVVGERCERAPSIAPNNLWPRLRSTALTSVCPLRRLSAFLSGAVDDVIDSRRYPLLSSVLSRGRLPPCSETEECRRLVPFAGEAAREGDGDSAVSGTTTTDNIILD